MTKETTINKYTNVNEKIEGLTVILNKIKPHIKTGSVPIVLFNEFQDYLRHHIRPMYSPGGIYYFERKHKGLRLDNIEDLEEKGHNVN